MRQEVNQDRMIILGVDPSFNRTGWAILAAGPTIVTTGVVKPGKGTRSEQLFRIERIFESAIEGYDLAAAYFEDAGAWTRPGGMRAETLVAPAMAKGVMLSVCAGNSIPAHEVKKAI